MVHAEIGEHALLRESALRFVSRSYGIDERTALARSTPGYAIRNWSTFAELGWLGIVAPDERGGIGGTIADAAVLAEAFGSGLLLEPFVAGPIFAGAILADARDARSARALEAMIEGTSYVAVALRERGDAFDPQHVQTRLTSGADGAFLDGTKIAVPFAATADAIVVTARDASDALRLVWVDANASGLTIDERPAADGVRRASITVAAAPVAGDLDLADPRATLVRALERAQAVTCAEAVGVMRRAFRDTVAHVNARTQFGQPIAAFQVVRHRIADMHVECELAAAAADIAASAIDGDAPDRARRVALAGYQVARSGRFVCESAVQLHGAMGIAAESAVSHALARVTALAATYGDTTSHLQRYLSEGT